MCILSLYDAGSLDASEYHDDGIGKVQPPEVIHGKYNINCTWKIYSSIHDVLTGDWFVRVFLCLFIFLRIKI